MRRSTTAGIQYDRPPPALEGRMFEGVVVSQQPGTNLLDVRIGPAGQRALRSVMVGYGDAYQAGDRVLVVRTPVTNHWIAVTRIATPDIWGLYQATAQAENELHPPSSFSVTTAAGMIIVEWETWVGGGDVAYLLQHNSSASDTNVTQFYTGGSYYIYKPTAATTHYFRVCSLRYDVSRREAYYSAWTAWTSATSVPVAIDADLEGLESGLWWQMHMMDWMWTEHLTGGEI